MPRCANIAPGPGRACDEGRLQEPIIMDWMVNPRERIAQMLEEADIRLDGSRRWDMLVHDDSMFARVLAHGSLGLGESYMDGAWDCDALDELFTRMLAAR